MVRKESVTPEEEVWSSDEDEKGEIVEEVIEEEVEWVEQEVIVEEGEEAYTTDEEYVPAKARPSLQVWSSDSEGEGSVAEDDEGEDGGDDNNDIEEEDDDIDKDLYGSDSLFVIENNGLKVTKDAKMGRITVATKNFAENQLHSTILKEIPALTCSNDTVELADGTGSSTYMNYLTTYLNLSKEAQRGILDMYYAPLDSEQGKSLLGDAKLLFLLGIVDDFELIHKLLSIYVTNAQELIYVPDTTSVGAKLDSIAEEDETQQPKAKIETTKAALSIVGSKFPHSCHPNVGYCMAMTKEGCMEYKMLVPRITKGTTLTQSYLADLFETPTYQRRELLLQTKGFVCQCDRCMGPDYCRQVRCQGQQADSDNDNDDDDDDDEDEGCTSIVPCTYTGDPSEKDNEPSWVCTTCGSLMNSDDIIVTERQIERDLDSIESAMKTNGYDVSKPPTDDLYSPSDLQEMVTEASENLSPIHYLTIRAQRLLVNLCKFHSLKLRYHNIPSSTYHTLYANIGARAGFSIILACECISQQCSGCYYDNGDDDDNDEEGNENHANNDDFYKIDNVTAHPPLFDRATTMRHICQDFILGDTDEGERVPLHLWPSYTVSLIEKYLPILKLKYGEDDTVVQQIESRILNKRRSMMVCTVLPPSSNH